MQVSIPSGHKPHKVDGGYADIGVMPYGGLALPTAL
jgi:hypothetical protein